MKKEYIYSYVLCLILLSVIVSCNPIPGGYPPLHNKQESHVIFTIDDQYTIDFTSEIDNLSTSYNGYSYSADLDVTFNEGLSGPFTVYDFKLEFPDIQLGTYTENIDNQQPDFNFIYLSTNEDDFNGYLSSTWPDSSVPESWGEIIVAGTDNESYIWGSFSGLLVDWAYAGTYSYNTHDIEGTFALKFSWVDD